MAFSDVERAAMLRTPGLGPAVIERLEEVGVDSVDRLLEIGAEAAVRRVCDRLGTVAWANRLRALRRFCEQVGSVAG